MHKKIKLFLSKMKQTGFFHIMAGNAFSNFFTFIAGIIIVRIVSKSDYGIYTYANNILSYFYLASGFGLATGVFQICCEYTNDIQKSNALYKYGFWQGIKINILLAFIILLYSHCMPNSIMGAKECLAVMSFLPIVRLLYEFVCIYFRWKRNNKSYAYSVCLHSGILCITSIIGSIISGIHGIIAAYYIAPVIVTLTAYLRFGFQPEKTQIRISKVDKKPIWNIGIASMISSAITQIMCLIDISVIGECFKDEQMVASYNVAAIIPTAMLFVPNSIMIYLAPHFASKLKDLEWTKKHYKQALLLVGALNLFISAAMFLLANPILHYIFGIQYADAVIPFRILCVSYFCNGTFRVVSANLLVIQRRFKFTIFEGSLVSVVNIVGDYILIGNLGSIGIAISTLSAMILAGILTTLYSLHILNSSNS